MSKIGAWSTTAGSNNATPPDGWPEGQLPSTVNDCAREMMAQIRTYATTAEWFDHNMTPTYVNADSFTVTGDQTSILEVGRKVKLFDGGNTIYRHIVAASFTAVTTLSLGAGTSITNSLSSFAVATMSQTNSSFPSHISTTTAGIVSISATSITISNRLSAQEITCVNILSAGGGIVCPFGAIRGKNGLVTNPSIIMDVADNDTGFYWVSDGIIGFACNSQQGARLSSGGFVSAAFTVSDERLKDNWQPLPADFIQRLAAIKSGTFEHKQYLGRQVGVGAQSLQTLLPEAISIGREDGLLAVQYGNAALVACVELAKEVQELKTRIKELENQHGRI